MSTCTHTTPMSLKRSDILGKLHELVTMIASGFYGRKRVLRAEELSPHLARDIGLLDADRTAESFIVVRRML